MDWFTLSSSQVNNLTCPQLSQIGQPSQVGQAGDVANGALSISYNQGLVTVQMPKLSQINGELSFFNNSDVVNVNGFPNLTTVESTAAFVGNFSRYVYSIM